ncbi:MAG: peptidyl-tRNA hydrolase Pth2 [Candidatus Aenigmarchaeota archaeon]|nr:peptidyl-tRNA hydrolase Pth2 [Candidatus Aenigmarchaeota archaeon]
MKQALILRRDLKLSAGKAAAQASHASVEAYKRADEESQEEWESEGQKKVVLRVQDEKELLELFMQAKREKLPCALIKDAGRTQIALGTATAVAIGPAEEALIDKLTGSLKLY